ncbi:hypothetical protein Ahy_B09g099378 [Arachis hypogaea]|uniref:Ubiquitin-like protease family profile domain-containing protein n=1 Tax=Arachis hypogaea TaxID=3818 RepID=A0A444XTS2_ARAHY|nr:hypothetical protein Ahy_B09g099378 [Arachis hypogaea]
MNREIVALDMGRKMMVLDMDREVVVVGMNMEMVVLDMNMEMVQTRNVLDMSVEGEENQKKFKRSFVVFIQKCFLLPTTVSVAFPIHKAPIFHVDNIREWDWTKHVLNFLMKGVENKRKGRKQSVNGCVFVLMLIYFHETKFPRLFAPDAPPAPWVAHWTRQMILERISSEATEPLRRRNKKNRNKEMVVKKQTKKIKPLLIDLESISESESQTEQAKDNTAERRKRALETIREKRSKKRNDGSQSTNIAPDQFDSPKAQNEFSQTPPLTLSLPSSVQEELIRDDFIYVPPQNETQQTSNNDCPPQPEKQGVTVSLTNSIIEEFFKDDYVYEVSNEEQQQQSQEPPVARQSEQETLILSSFDSMTLNQIKVRRYQEQIYIVPLDIVNFMLGTHGESYTDKRTNKAYRFDIEQYAHHCQFLDKRKLASHPFLFVPICNGAHWWLWIADVNKKKFYVLDLVNKLPKDIPNLRKKLNKFVGEIDSFRYQYGPHILLHEMNKIRDQVIWESEAIRLPKLSAVLSSPYCKFTYGDLDSK